MRVRHILLSLAAALGFVVLVSSFTGANDAGTISNTYLAQRTVETGDTLANSTTPTNMASDYTMPAGQFTRGGQTIMFVAGGTCGSNATPTLELEFLDGSTVIWDSGATTLGSGVTNLNWNITVHLVCVLTGASGTVRAFGSGHMGGVIVAAPEMGATPIAGTGTIAFDTTVAHTFTVRATWSAAHASNTVTQGFLFGYLGN